MDSSEIKTVMTYIMEKVFYHKTYGQVVDMTGEPFDSTFNGMPVYIMAKDISGPFIIVQSPKISDVEGYPTISQDSLELRYQNSNDRLFYTLFRLLLKKYIVSQVLDKGVISYSPENITNISKQVTLVVNAPSGTNPVIWMEVEKMGTILGMKTEKEWGAKE
jgi:hypothetical protein